MTTPTREQALTPAELRELCDKLSEHEQAMLHRAVHAAHMSVLELGRAQGLREAAAECKRIAAEDYGMVNHLHEYGECAAAIEQLRGE